MSSPAIGRWPIVVSPSTRSTIYTAWSSFLTLKSNVFAPRLEADVSGTLGVAVVGLGVGEQHALTYAKLPECTLQWLYDLDRARADSVCARVGRGAAAESFESIMADGAVDLVSIASYDDAHYGQVVAALSANKHVFVEKPLCGSLREIEQIKQERERTGRHLVSNLVLRAAQIGRAQV